MDLTCSVTAIVDGKPITEIPADLFIPPDALEVLLDSFTGPLDLLLYLIRRQNINILDIPMVLITKQYLHYIELMEKQRLELAADYLVMATVLAEIKSAMLLPVVTEPEQEDCDPRMELVRRLQLYEQFKHVAMHLDDRERLERDVFQIQVQASCHPLPIMLPEVRLLDLTNAMLHVLQQQNHLQHHQISKEPLSVRERMTYILKRLNDELIIDFNSLFTQNEGRKGLVVSLLAMLELAKQALVVVTQTSAYTPIYIKAC